MEPRIPPVSVAHAPDEIRDTLEQFSRLRGDDASVLNVFGTLANHPKLFRRWLVFANHVLLKSTLDPRTRELAILRVGWRCHAPYEWGQHVVVGRAAGLTDDDIRRVAAGPDAEGWTPADAATLCATDEQVLDLVFAVGNYHIVSFALNACGVQRDDGVDDTTLPFPPAAS